MYGIMRRMRCRVTRMFRQGRRISDRLLANEPAVAGQLQVAWVVDNQRHRLVHFASLVEDTSGGIRPRLIPDLLDPVLMSLGDRRMSLSGFEAVESGEHRQTWLVALTP